MIKYQTYGGCEGEETIVPGFGKSIKGLSEFKLIHRRIIYRVQPGLHIQTLRTEAHRSVEHDLA